MDNERFDGLIKALGCTGSRRKAIGGFLAGVLTLGGGAALEADARKKAKGAGKKAKAASRGGRATPRQITCSLQQCPNGCCAEQGGCVNEAEQSNLACGAAGTVCQVCGDDETCENVNGTPQCVQLPCAQRCPEGCCDGDVCRANGSGVCGTGGIACVPCANGCCDSAGVCQTGTTDVQCGDGGNLCADCTGFGGGDGTCTGQQCNLCNENTCPNGCCNAQGQCRPGNTTAACRTGTGGSACAVCGEGLSCIPDQSGPANICQLANCDAITCPDGCCDGDGVCRTGESDFRCGADGVACAECGFDQTCQDGICVDDPIEICGPDNCPNGCCDENNVCRNGDTINACGDGGQTCATCTDGAVCVQGSCQSDGPDCPVTFELCDGRCVDLGTNRRNCGACGVTCRRGRGKRGQVCRGGTCVNRGGRKKK